MITYNKINATIFFLKKYQIRIRHFVAIVHKWETILLILKRKGQGSHNKLGQYKIGNTNRECVRRNKGKGRNYNILKVNTLYAAPELFKFNNN
jgi:hypothetical protein